MLASQKSDAICRAADPTSLHRVFKDAVGGKRKLKKIVRVGGRAYLGLRANASKVLRGTPSNLRQIGISQCVELLASNTAFLVFSCFNRFECESSQRRKIFGGKSCRARLCEDSHSIY